MDTYQLGANIKPEQQDMGKSSPTLLALEQQLQRRKSLETVIDSQTDDADEAHEPSARVRTISLDNLETIPAILH